MRLRRFLRRCDGRRLHAEQCCIRGSDAGCEWLHLYLELLREYATRHGLRLWAYSLMTNHTHLIVVPDSESALSDTLRDAHSAYASMFNRAYGYSGHLWQGRFYSCLLDADHLAHAVRYVECNPVRAEMVFRAEDYQWSSAIPHVMGIEDRYLDSGLPLLGVVRWATSHASRR